MKVAAAALAVLSVAALALTGWYAVQVRDAAAGYATPRDDAPVAAEQAAEALFSYDYQRLPADRKRAQGRVTDEFGRRVLQAGPRRSRRTARRDSPCRAEPVVTANVLGSGVVDAEADRVRVLVYVNQVSEKPDKDPQIFQNRVALTMARDGSRWLVRQRGRT